MPSWSHPHVTNMSPPHTSPQTQTCAVKFSESSRGAQRNTSRRKHFSFIFPDTLSPKKEWREKRGGVLFSLKEWENRARFPLRAWLLRDVIPMPWLPCVSIVRAGRRECIQHFLSFIVTGRTNRQSAVFTNTLLVNNTQFLPLWCHWLWEQVEEEYNQTCQTGSAPHSTSSPFNSFSKFYFTNCFKQ